MDQSDQAQKTPNQTQTGSSSTANQILQDGWAHRSIPRPRNSSRG